MHTHTLTARPPLLFCRAQAHQLLLYQQELEQVVQQANSRH
jgi:hypothetical protein